MASSLLHNLHFHAEELAASVRESVELRRAVKHQLATTRETIVFLPFCCAQREGVYDDKPVVASGVALTHASVLGAQVLST